MPADITAADAAAAAQEAELLAWLAQDMDSFEADIAPDLKVANSSSSSNSSRGHSSSSAASRRQSHKDTACTGCSSLSVLGGSLFELGMFICYACRQKDPEAYRLITKGSAKKDWLVRDKELLALPNVKKENKSKPTWGKMTLYLQSAVVALSRVRFPSDQLLDAEKRKRGVARLEKAMKLKKRKEREARGEIFFDSPRKKSRKNGRAPKKVTLPPVSRHKHSMQWDAAKKTDTCTSCGHVVQFEAL
jgi:hypothetical protein